MKLGLLLEVLGLLALLGAVVCGNNLNGVELEPLGIVGQSKPLQHNNIRNVGGTLVRIRKLAPGTQRNNKPATRIGNANARAKVGVATTVQIQNTGKSGIGVSSAVQNNLAPTTTKNNMKPSQEVLGSGKQPSGGTEGRTYTVPRATFGFELEGYSQGIFDFLTPKRKVHSWEYWNSDQRAEYFLTQQKWPQGHSAGDVRLLKKALEESKKELKIMDYGKDFDINNKAPSKDWLRVYTELNDDVMWEVVSKPVSNLDNALRRLDRTMIGTSNRSWRRVQMTVHLDISLVKPNKDKLVALTASANFALALFSKDSAVLHPNNDFPTREAMSLLLQQVNDSPMNINDAFKNHLMAIRATPISNKKEFRFEFRVLSSEEFARCMISAFLEAAADTSTHIPTFGHCFSNKDCSQVSNLQGYDSIQPLTTKEVTTWMLNAFPTISHTVQGDNKFNIDFIKDIAKAHPSWSNQEELVSAIGSGKMRQTIKCLLAQADKKP